MFHCYRGPKGSSDEKPSPLEQVSKGGIGEALAVGASGSPNVGQA